MVTVPRECVWGHCNARKSPILGQVGSVLRQALLLLEMARTALADGPRRKPTHQTLPQDAA